MAIYRSDLVPAQKSYGAEADALLEKLYSSVGCTTARHKINLLDKLMGGECNLTAPGSTVPEERVLGCLEWEYLDVHCLLKEPLPDVLV